ncbi:MAG TPA: hypothetical protein VJL28_12475 [Gemmatimonadaceae bacterium]|nr:hypothetical protein [Gemmatimonadaceae bacterium]
MTSSQPEKPDAPATPAAAPTAAPRRGLLRRHWGKLTIASIVLVPALIFTGWAGIALSYSYSSGNRVGYVQKFSKKGWVCKTWEGELAMVNLPGAMSQIFTFSVRSDSVAGAIEEAMRKGRVELTYDQHIGVPTSCFGETQYFVTGVRSLPG